jgi:hypothetical protein
MKLVNVLLASASVILGIAACAAPASEEREAVEESSQALCMKGQICTGSSSGFLSSTSGGVLDPGTSTSSSGTTTSGYQCNVPPGGSFYCSGSVKTCNGGSAKATSYPCDMTVRCLNGSCDCVPGCGGGGWTFGSWNPCMYGRTYTCDSSGYCRCS